MDFLGSHDVGVGEVVGGRRAEPDVEGVGDSCLLSLFLVAVVVRLKVRIIVMVGRARFRV